MWVTRIGYGLGYDFLIYNVFVIMQIIIYILIVL